MASEISESAWDGEMDFPDCADTWWVKAFSMLQAATV